MKIKVTSLVKARLALKNKKGEFKYISPEKSVTMDEAEFKSFAKQCELFKKSGKIKIEEVKGKAKPQKPAEPVVDAPVVEDEKPAEKVTKKKVAKKVAKKKVAKKTRRKKSE
jgi:hypothetical protein